MTKKSIGILVCGMQRSGTSALGGALDACGVVLRENMAANENNPKGYFEKVEVVDLHEEFFGEFGLDGVSLAPLPDDWEESESAERTRIRIADLVEKNFANDRLWAVKDPRLCRLAPLWRRALPEIDLRVVLAIRDPLEVAASLKRFYGYPWSRGLLFWLRYVLESERNSRGLKRAIVRYEDLLKSPVSVTQRIEAELELQWPNPPEVRDEKLQSWIEPNLNRNASSRNLSSDRNLEALVDLCLAVYGLFQPESNDRRGDLLDAIWDRCLIKEHSFIFTTGATGCMDSLPSQNFMITLDDPFNGRLLSDGWYYSFTFGYYNTSLYPWVYHRDFGFIYVVAHDSDLYLYFLDEKSGIKGWAYTSRKLLPCVYSFSKSAWLYCDDGYKFNVDVPMGENWYHSSSLGFYNARHYPWVYRSDFGFAYVIASEDSDLYFYVPGGTAGSLGWLYTKRSIFPNVYSFTKNSWLYVGDDACYYDYSLASWEFFQRAAA